MSKNWKEEAIQAYQNQRAQDNEGGCSDSVSFIFGYLAAKDYDYRLMEIKDAQMIITQG